MEHRTLEINVISAKDLQNVNLISKMDVYAVVSLSGEPKSPSEQQRTAVDRNGNRNPTWNFQVRFVVDQSAIPRLSVTFTLRCERNLGDKDIGDVRVPLTDLIASAETGKLQFVAYQVRKPSGKPKGELNFSYKWGEKVSGAPPPPLNPEPKPVTAYPKPEPAYPEPVTAYPKPEPAYPEPVTAYPAPAVGSSSGYPGAPPPYPPYPGHPDHGYYPSQPGHGYYPNQQPSYGYYPNQQPGYGYYPNQPGYGSYPPVQQPVAKKNNKLGLGLGAGLLGGAIGGLLIGDMVSDAAFDGGFCDAGF
ncbi:calcium-dependent lipid-binding (CaLB domain) family protein [Actinidia rufa]|uniref:Calcium-dependent lipid-binding (CaLB domain) family protein n=1 Tax=Actinidia rufa TaxID=165716 RepID=A0A7J0HFS6_9ERIC|nr:calcium-dependent lipid-binding (CaLB domain) family protein [Actinidia rufa]